MITSRKIDLQMSVDKMLDGSEQSPNLPRIL